MTLRQDDHLSLFINASRVGNVGGLRAFAEALVRCLEHKRSVHVKIPDGIAIDTTLPQSKVPSWVASSGRISLLRPLLWSLYSVILSQFDRDARVLSCTHHAIPFRKHQILSIHDVRPFYFPDSWLQKLYFRYGLPLALRRCDGVITVSEASRNEISKIYQINQSAIHIVPNVIDSKFFCPEAAAVPTRPYLLSVGGTWEHKNIIEILEINDLWKLEYDLKVVASDGQYIRKLRKIAEKLDITSNVEFVGSTNFHELRTLYRGCSALVYPSLMEGFGLPPLEAMACMKPVIVSDIPVFREILSDVPIFIQLKNERSWKDAFKELACFPIDRLKSGRALAESFSQERMSYALSEALESVWGIQLGVQDK